eukprot:scpid83128/ scgid28533/ 
MATPTVHQRQHTGHRYYKWWILLPVISTACMLLIFNAPRTVSRTMWIMMFGKTIAPPVYSNPIDIHHGTFLYLVMEESAVPNVYVQTSLIKDVHVIFLAWKTAPPKSNVGKVQTDFFPKSSWASGRNRLSDLALQREEQQGWSFEFWIFCDGDARLIKRHNRTVFPLGPTHMEASERLRTLLLRDRPARAGLAYPSFPLEIAKHPMECVRNCANDAAIDIFHRTAINPVLPYPTAFDSVSWWMASETTSYRSAAAFSDYCNTYREVVLDRRGNMHAEYPGQDGIGRVANYRTLATSAFRQCVSDLRNVEHVWQRVQRHGIYRAQAEDNLVCTTQHRDVNYSALIADPEMQIFQTC